MAKNDKKPATARSGAVEILQQVLGEGAYTNIAVNKFLRSHELSDMDRRLMTELVYGTVKAVGTIDWYLQQCVTRPLDKIDKLVLSILRISVYQLLYMDKPDLQTLEAMDLYMISEIKRPKDGAMEIKFFDRLKALEKLSEAQQASAENSLPFYKALENSAEILNCYGVAVNDTD